MRIGWAATIETVDRALSSDDGLVIITTQRSRDTEEVRPFDLFGVGCVSRVVEWAKSKEPGCIDIKVQGLMRGRLLSFEEGAQRIVARVAPIRTERVPLEVDVTPFRQLSRRLVARQTEHKEAAAELIESIQIAEHLIDMVVANAGLPDVEKQRVLEIADFPTHLALATELIETLVKLTPPALHVVRDVED